MKGDIPTFQARTVGYVLQGIGLNKHAECREAEAGIQDDISNGMKRIAELEKGSTEECCT